MVSWGEHEIEQLKHFYKEFNVPSDQIVKDKTVLEKFSSSFNARLNRDKQFRPKEIADQLFKLRKGGKLPRIRD